MRINLVLVSVLMMATFASAESEPAQPKSPKINLNEQVKESVEKPKPAKQTNYSTNKQSPPIPQPVTTIEKPVTETKKENRGDDRPEFYISICGFGLKITDILMIILTGTLAWYTRGLHRSTEKLWNAGEKQMKITSDSLEITRQEFNFVHRPKLTIRREQLRVDLDTKGINFVLANTGDLPATNIIGNINVKVIPIQETSDFEKESMPRYGDAAIDISQIVFQRRNSKMLQSGEREFIFFASGEINETTIPSIGRGDYYTLYFYGILDFEGPDGVRRESAFFRKFNPETKTFTPKDDIDYEHC